MHTFTLTEEILHTHTHTHNELHDHYDVCTQARDQALQDLSAKDVLLNRALEDLTTATATVDVRRRQILKQVLDSNAKEVQRSERLVKRVRQK